jgi:sugar fermentation stimulation protein A
MAHVLPYKLPLLHGTFLARRIRFFADVKLASGELITAMCANTGSMKSCCEPGRPVVISDSQSETRKIKHTWELIDMGEGWVNVNTGIPNWAVAEFIARGAIPELTGFAHSRREVKYGKGGASRIDLLLSHEPWQPPEKPARKPKKPPTPPVRAGDMYVEVKNTSMRAGKHSLFPDSVTERGQKHLRELMDVVKKGARAAMFYFVGRTDTQAFRPADEIDKEYGKLFRKAIKAGVEVLPYRVKFTPGSIELGEKLPLDI